MQTVLKLNNDMLLHVSHCYTWKKEDWSVPISEEIHRLNRLVTLHVFIPSNDEDKKNMIRHLKDNERIQVWQIADDGSALYGMGYAKNWCYEGQMMRIVFDAGQGFVPGVLSKASLQEVKEDE